MNFGFTNVDKVTSGIADGFYKFINSGNKIDALNKQHSALKLQLILMLSHLIMQISQVQIVFLVMTSSVEVVLRQL